MYTLIRSFVLSTLILFSAAAQAEPIKIKFSHVVAVNTPKGQMAEKFKALVEERLPGKVVVEVFPNSQLFGDNKVLEAILLGDVQLAAPSLSKFKKYTKQLQVFDLPFLFNDIKAVDNFMKSPEGQSLLNSTEGKGLQGLGFLHNGMKQLSANTPLRVPADAKNLKFRIMSSDVLAAQFKAIDASPQKKPFSEVFTLLQTKAIDGQENTWSNIYSKKFFEVQDYVTESNHGYLGYMVVTSKDFWGKMPADVRAVVDKSLAEAIEHGNKIALEKAVQDKQAIIDSKRSNVVEITADQRAQWVNVMKPVWGKFEKEIGKDLINAGINSNK